jgi:LysM repeat protein
MGECYNPYPKLPKNIRQIGERDPVVKLYVEDYVSTYLKRLYPTGGRDLRVGLLLGEIRSEEGIPYIFVDGALEMENVTADGEKVNFTETAWKEAWKTMERSFPKRAVLGWFLCGAQGCMLSPLNYWREHGQYFSARYQLMYLNSSLEGDEALYVASEDGFYRLRGYCIYYERNQMMQDYMISRKDARRVESGARDEVIRDFRQKMETRKEEVRRRSTLTGFLGTACGVLSVAVLAGSVVMFGNYRKMKEMEAVIASVLPSGVVSYKNSDEVDIEEIDGDVYPTKERGNVVDAKMDKAVLEAGAEGILSGGNMTASDSGDMAGVDETEAGQAEKTASENAAEPRSAAGGTEAGSGASPSGMKEMEPVQASAQTVTYIVQEGETLYGICLNQYQNLTMIPEICRLNGLEDENRISVGQKLLLPAEGLSSAQ